MKPGGSSGVPIPDRVPEILPEHLPNDLLSIAVFGPGEGEAIVVRLPNGAVGVVDGCREPQAKHPHGRGDPVRELLKKIADRSTIPFRLEFVCLTHPHADHFRGLGRLVAAYEGKIARLWTVTHVIPRYESVLPKWLALTRAGTAPDEEDLTGLTRVLANFHREKEHVKKSNAQGYMHLSQGKTLMRQLMGTHDLSIESCGPADADLDEAQKQLVNIVDAAARGEDVSPNHDPNLTSGALLLRWGSAAILLGGDLLRGNGRHLGWQGAHFQINDTVQVVNVAHHASDEAHDPSLWAKMRPALTIVTPFKYGKAPYPPRPTSVGMLARTSVVAITSPPDWEHEPSPPTALYGAKVGSALPTPTKTIPSPRAKSPTAHRNAVAVSLDATGEIKHFVLAGQADVYDR